MTARASDRAKEMFSRENNSYLMKQIYQAVCDGEG